MAIFVFLAFCIRCMGKYTENWSRGPNFGLDHQTLNCYKMVNNGWNNLKFGMYELHAKLFPKKKFFFQNPFFDRDMGENVKTERFLAKNGENAKIAIFLAKIGKIIPNMDFNKDLGGIYKFDHVDF